MSDLMRSQFEEWQLQVYCGGSERLRKCKNDESYYYYTDVQMKWKAWQASREFLVIDLPESFEFHDPYEAGLAIRACRESIHAAGVKTK